MRLDGMTDISHARAGLDRFDAETVAPERRHEKLHRVFTHLAHGDGRGIIPVKALHHERDVDADDIALLQDLLRVGDAVADDVVHRGADALGKAPVVEWCGDDVVLPGKVDLEIVDLLGRHAGNDLLDDPLEALGREPAGPGHGLDLGLTLDEDEAARLVEIDAVGVLFHHTVNRKFKRPFWLGPESRQDGTNGSIRDRKWGQVLFSPAHRKPQCLRGKGSPCVRQSCPQPCMPNPPP